MASTHQYRQNLPRYNQPVCSDHRHPSPNSRPSFTPEEIQAREKRAGEFWDGYHKRRIEEKIAKSDQNFFTGCFWVAVVLCAICWIILIVSNL